MIPIHVALVRYCAEEYVTDDEVRRVAAALQIQLTRDFSPIWGIPATVSPYRSPDEAPPASIPLVIVDPGSLYPRARGFHITDGGQPVALIEGTTEWSLAASHELLEIVCDPEGKRKVAGKSIVDLDEPMTFALGADKYRRPQGEVAYLLEICDPCQAPEFAYTVDRFQVSDFVTPRFYDPSGTKAAGYSFTGAVTRPLEILTGGYITWYTSIPQAPIWQATKNGGILQVGLLAVPAPSFSRHRVDYLTDHLAPVAPGSGAVASGGVTMPAASDNTIKAEVDRVLAGYHADRQWKVPPAELLKILDQLADDENYWKGFENNPNSLLSNLTDMVPEGSFYPGWRLPSQEVFQGVRDWLKKRVEDGADDVTGGVATTMMKGGMPWPPPPPPPPPPTPPSGG